VTCGNTASLMQVRWLISRSAPALRGRVGDCVRAGCKIMLKPLLPVERQWREHAPLDAGDGRAGCTQYALAVWGELRGQGPAMSSGSGSADQATLLEPAQDLVHRLASDERAAGQLGVGLARPLAEEFQTGVLRHGQLERAQGDVHSGAQGDRGPLEDVAHSLVELTDGFLLTHVSILTHTPHVRTLTYRKCRE